MIQEGALVKGCSKSDAIWASFMGSFAILGGSSPPSPPPITTPMKLRVLCTVCIAVQSIHSLHSELCSKLF